MKRKYIIWSPPFDETAGGTIALHVLCHELNLMGEKAYIWPATKQVFESSPIAYILIDLIERCGLQNLVVFLLKRLYWIPWISHTITQLSSQSEPSGVLRTPIARHHDLRNAIVVYPEIVSGNPLGAKRVVRWMLHRPGFHTGEINFGEHDLLFYYALEFRDPHLDIDPENLLKTLWIRNDIYQLQNTGPRSGTCYMLRKGKGRTLKHDVSDWILVDELSHAEMARVFNECKYFYSYDPITMYSHYAAICGCISIVVPEEGVSKEQWRPDLTRRYGIAYGEHDIDFATSTRDLLIEQFEKEQDQSRETVRHFVDVTRREFSNHIP